MRARLPAAILVCMLAAGCSRKPVSFGTDYTRDAKTFDPKALTMVQEDTGLTLPHGARGSNLYYEGSHFDPEFYARIEIPDSEGQAFANQLTKIPDSNVESNGPSLKKVPWWMSSTANVVVKRTFTPKAGAFARVTLCKENDLWILYIEWGA